MPGWFEIGPVVLEKIVKCSQCIFAISLQSPFGKEQGFHLYKLESPSPRNALWQVLLKLAPLFWRFFKFSNELFCYFLIISTCKMAWLFIFTNLNAHHPRMLYSQVWLNLTVRFLRRRRKCEKFTDRRTNRRQTTPDQKAHLIFQLTELKMLAIWPSPVCSFLEQYYLNESDQRWIILKDNKPL